VDSPTRKKRTVWASKGHHHETWPVQHTHRAHGKSPDKGVRIVGVFAKCVDGKKSEVRVALGIVDDI
jgi:hypothetical protein